MRSILRRVFGPDPPAVYDDGKRADGTGPEYGPSCRVLLCNEGHKGVKHCPDQRKSDKLEYPDQYRVRSAGLKIYCFVGAACPLDKYHTIVLVFMIGGVVIGAYNMNWGMFWVMVAGAVGIILYSSYATRRQRQEERRRERRRRRGQD